MRSEGPVRSDHCRPLGQGKEFRFSYNREMEKQWKEFKVRQWEGLVYSSKKKMISLLLKGRDKAAGRGLEAGLVGGHWNGTHRGRWPGTAEMVEDWANREHFGQLLMEFRGLDGWMDKKKE